MNTITGDDWKRELKAARATPNSISGQIKMKLHPINPIPDPTPKTGLEFLPNEALIMRALLEIATRVDESLPRFGECMDAKLMEELYHRSK